MTDPGASDQVEGLLKITRGQHTTDVAFIETSSSSEYAKNQDPNE